ncbi:hypothetical protein ACFSTC_02925 [Nonomuraea ferruginea]
MSVIALLTTAYAALVGFVLTFLVGYPLTLGVALIAAALVPAASLLTARVLNHPERDLAEKPGHGPHGESGGDFAAAASWRRRWFGGG